MPTINSNSFKINKNLITIILFILIGSILSFIYLKPFLGFKDTLLLRLDWHKEFQLTAATWVSLVKYGEFPFWNPYKGGGNFNFAHPESHVLSPETLFIVLFGPIKGLYYSVLFFYIIGFIGCYFIGRHLKLTFLGKLYLAIVFTFSSYVMNNLFVGSATWMMVGYIPYAFYFLLKAENDWRYGIIAGFFHALLYLGGAIYPFMFFMLFAVIFVLSSLIIKKDYNYIKGLIALVIFSFLFSSIKLLPSLDLYLLNPRKVGIEKIPFGLDLLKKAFLDKAQAWNIVSAYDYKGTNFHFPYYGDYVGIIPLILAAIGIVLLTKSRWSITFFGISLIYLSSYAPFSFIWSIVHAIPPFDSLQRQARILVYFNLILGIVGAIVVSKIDSAKIKDTKSMNLLKKILILGLILFVFIDLTKSSYIITDNFKPWPMQEGLIKWEEQFEYYDFIHRFNLSQEQINVLYANYFKNFAHIDTLSNKGSNIYVYDPMPLTKARVKGKGDMGYKGEYYFEKEGNNYVQLLKRTTNKISLKVKTDKENVLIVNQNFHKMWKTKENFEIVNKDGLVGIKLQPGEYAVNLYVFQDKFIIGIITFLIGIVLGVYFLIGIYKKDNSSSISKS